MVQRIDGICCHALGARYNSIIELKVLWASGSYSESQPQAEYEISN